MDTFKEVAKVVLNLFYFFCSALFGIYLGAAVLDVLGDQHSIYIYVLVALGGMYVCVGSVQDFMHEPFSDAVEGATGRASSEADEPLKAPATNESDEPEDMEALRDRGHTRPSRPFHY
jgi:hypothetical protein